MSKSLAWNDQTMVNEMGTPGSSQQLSERGGADSCYTLSLSL